MSNFRRYQFWDFPRLTAAGVTSLSFFNVQQGATDPVSSLSKTLEETNVTKSNQFPYDFKLNRIRTYINILPKNRQPSGINNQTNTVTKWMRGMMSAFADLASTGVLNVVLNNKNTLRIEQPFRLCPPGFGVDIDQVQSNDTYALWSQQNRQAPLYDVTPELIIKRDDVLQVTIDFPNTSPVFTNLVNSTSPYINIGLIFEGYADVPLM